MNTEPWLSTPQEEQGTDGRLYKMKVKDVGRDGVGWIPLAQDSHTLVNKALGCTNI
jgi:hypothetical protein